MHQAQHQYTCIRRVRELAAMSSIALPCCSTVYMQPVVRGQLPSELVA